MRCIKRDIGDLEAGATYCEMVARNAERNIFGDPNDHHVYKEAATRLRAEAATEPPKPKHTYDMVQLADNEWGNTIMEEVAEEWFKEHLNCQFVEVREHAGWFLGYHRDTMEVIATANDMAVMRQDRPRPSEFSGLCHRRPVIRPDIREVTTLKQYQPCQSSS